jgi:broad specificity phosphatase PhoE
MEVDQAVQHYDFTDFTTVDPGLGAAISACVVTMRHAETRENAELMKGGAPGSASAGTPENLTLTEVGERQVADTLAELKKLPGFFDVIVCSPLDRAVKTAEVIHAGLVELAKEWDFTPPSLDIHPSLREFRRKHAIELPAPHNEVFAEAFHKSVSPKQTWLYPQETQREFHERIEVFKNSMPTAYKHKNVLIITHSMVLNSLYGGGDSFLRHNKEKTVSHHPNCSLGSICITEPEDGEYVMNPLFFGYTRHLETPTGHHSPFNTMHLVKK